MSGFVAAPILKRGARSGSKSDSSYLSLHTESPMVGLESFDLMQSVGCEVALPTIRAGDNRDILDDEELFPLAICLGHAPDLCTWFSTNVTFHRASWEAVLQ